MKADNLKVVALRDGSQTFPVFKYSTGVRLRYVAAVLELIRSCL